MIRNADNNVGVWTWYEGEAGVTGFTIYAELRVAFRPTDAPASSPSAGGFTLTEIYSIANLILGTSLAVRRVSVDQGSRTRIVSAMTDSDVVALYVVLDTGSISSGVMIWKLDNTARTYLSLIHI